ncbi:MAG TPA: outer membrane beta-barrel protein [Flavisolibacter sp.]|nr:outer membrane beta-barrel protein [Flavisolibacter sp.]
MRKIYALTIALVCFSFLSQAQISKGSNFLGGSVGYYNMESEDTNPQVPNLYRETKQSRFSILPQIGIAIKENQVFGVSLNYTSNRYEQENNVGISKAKGSLYGGGIFYRRYFPIAQRFLLFGNGDLGVVFDKGETVTSAGTTNYVSVKSKGQRVSLALTPGISFAASRKLFLETSFNGLLNVMYNSSTQDDFNQQGNVILTQDQKTFSANADANGFSALAVGIRWILPSK